MTNPGIYIVGDLANRMTALREAPSGDPESDHSEADKILILCLRLATLEWPSFERIADDYEIAARKFWYA